MKKIAEILLKIKAVTLSTEKPYTWASGIKSPIYCDNRLILSYPEEREIVEAAMADLIKEKFPDTEILMGTATAGIPHAAISAYKLNLPMGFVRGQAKDHGKTNAIEGCINDGIKTVVVEDLVSTGGSSLKVAEILRENNCQVLGMVAVFTYGMEKAKQAFAEHKVDLYTLTNFNELLEVAVESGYIDELQKRKLETFMRNPGDESWQKLK